MIYDVYLIQIHQEDYFYCNYHIQISRFMYIVNLIGLFSFLIVDKQKYYHTFYGNYNLTKHINFFITCFFYITTDMLFSIINGQQWTDLLTLNTRTSLETHALIRKDFIIFIINWLIYLHQLVKLKATPPTLKILQIYLRGCFALIIPPIHALKNCLQFIHVHTNILLPTVLI